MAQVWGFKYGGKDKRGVSQWRGSGNWERLLKGVGTGFIIYGVCAACVCFALLLFALLTLSWPAAIGVLVYVSGIHALTFGGMGLWMRSLRKHILSLKPADQLSDRFGVPETMLAQVAQDKGIKPRMSINGMDYYNPADFANASEILLRAAARPNDTQEILLRPATADISTHPEQLLRVPSSDLEAAQTVAPAVAVAPSYIQMETSDEQPLQEIQRQ